MVTKKEVQDQLKKIGFDTHGWNKSEVNELHQILLTDEEIYECVNGIYEGGFALLVATDVRILLVDKKPLNFLSVEDIRFDMINEIDYSHRLMGANIRVTTGSKALNFRSYNKERLRKLIGHVQHCMAENKKKQSTHAEDQKQHLEQINNQLQTYLVAQYKQQQKIQEHLSKQPNGAPIEDKSILEPVKPSNELSDYLFAHGLIDKYRQDTGEDLMSEISSPEVFNEAKAVIEVPTRMTPQEIMQKSQIDEIYADGMKEIFGNNIQQETTPTSSNIQQSSTRSLEINPVRIAFSKLPMLRQSRELGLSTPSSKISFPVA